MLRWKPEFRYQIQVCTGMGQGRAAKALLSGEQPFIVFCISLFCQHIMDYGMASSVTFSLKILMCVCFSISELLLSSSTYSDTVAARHSLKRWFVVRYILLRTHYFFHNIRNLFDGKKSRNVSVGLTEIFIFHLASNVKVQLCIPLDFTLKKEYLMFTAVFCLIFLAELIIISYTMSC